MTREGEKVLTRTNLEHFEARAKRAILESVDESVPDPAQRDKLRRVVMDTVELFSRRVWDAVRENGGQVELYPHD